MKDASQEMSAQAALALEQNPNATEDPKQVALTRRIAFIAKCIQNDEAALLKVLSVESKLEMTPKRRKRSDFPDADDNTKQLEDDNTKQLQSKYSDDNPNKNALKNAGAHTFSEAKQNMAQEVDVYAKIGKVPRELREGTSKISGKPFTILKAEVSQPGATHTMHLIAWAPVATRMHTELLAHEDSVIRLRKAKYEYNSKQEEHQLKLSDKSTVEKVENKATLAAFEDAGDLETTTSISRIGESRQYARLNVKGYVRTCDDTPCGPSKNGSYWRNFELCDSLGNQVKGVAWGSSATNTWIPEVTVEMFSVSVRKSDERIQLDEASVVIFKEEYDLGTTKPAYFKPVVWSRN